MGGCGCGVMLVILVMSWVVVSSCQFCLRTSVSLGMGLNLNEL